MAEVYGGATAVELRVTERGAHMLVIHPNTICPPRPPLLPSEVDDLARVAWRMYSDAVLAFQEQRNPETAAAMSLAFGRFVSLFVPEKTDA